MSKENIIAPELEFIKSSEFYLFYEMMMQALRTDDVKEGMNKSLFLLRSFLDSGNIILYRKNSNGSYVFKISDSSVNVFPELINSIVNKSMTLVEQRKILKLNLNLSEELQNVVLLHTELADCDCILAVVNVDKNKNLESLFWERTRETIQIILKRAFSYEKNVKAITTDLLTGLDNRNSYEMRIQSLNEEDANLVVGIFDLFRLKYINDNYTHAKGDAYIKEAANILSKYWPKYNVFQQPDGKEEFVKTGHCVYRIGGDEFVLLTNEDSLRLAEVKAKLVADETQMINLDIKEKVPIGLNYGLVLHNKGDYFKRTFIRADEIMQNNKQETYKQYKLERRQSN